MKRTRLHLDIFKVFCDLTQSQSFSKTAARNFLTQSAVSQQISFLEKHFGKKLIHRGRGRIRLTEEGAALLEGSRNILRSYQEILDKIERRAADISGSVRVETVYSVGLHQLAPYVRSFMRRYPRVNLHVEYNRSDRVYSNVIDGVCDLGIIAYPRAHPNTDILPFKREKLALICPPDHPFARRKRVRLKALQGQNFIAFHRDIPTRRAVDGILREAGVDVHILQEFDNIETLKRSVEVGAGISILPEITVAQEIKAGALCGVALAGGPYTRPIGILCRQPRTLSRAAEEFLRWLSQNRPPAPASGRGAPASGRGGPASGRVAK